MKRNKFLTVCLVLAMLLMCCACSNTDKDPGTTASTGPEELTAAKQALISQLKSTHDSPGAIENYYAVAALSGLPLTPQSYIRAVEATTAQDVAAAAQKVKLHT